MKRFAFSFFLFISLTSVFAENGVILKGEGWQFESFSDDKTPEVYPYGKGIFYNTITGEAFLLVQGTQNNNVPYLLKLNRFASKSSEGK